SPIASYNAWWCGAAIPRSLPHDRFALPPADAGAIASLFLSITDGRGPSGAAPPRRTAELPGAPGLALAAGRRPRPPGVLPARRRLLPAHGGVGPARPGAVHAARYRPGRAGARAGPPRPAGYLATR